MTRDSSPLARKEPTSRASLYLAAMRGFGVALPLIALIGGYLFYRGASLGVELFAGGDLLFCIVGFLVMWRLARRTSGEPKGQIKSSDLVR